MPGLSDINAARLPATASAGGLSSVSDAPSGILDSLGNPGSPLGTVARTAGTGLKSKAGSLLDFAEAHPNATSGLLSGLGSIQSSGSENRLRNAQANALEQTGGLTANELAQRKASQASLAPLWSSFASGPGRTPVAANPYRVGG